MPSSEWTCLRMGASPGRLQICALQLGTSNSCTGMQPLVWIWMSAAVPLSLRFGGTKNGLALLVIFLSALQA